MVSGEKKPQNNVKYKYIKMHLSRKCDLFLKKGLQVIIATMCLRQCISPERRGAAVLGVWGLHSRCQEWNSVCNLNCLHISLAQRIKFNITQCSEILTFI